MDTFFGLYFHFCLEIAQKTSAKASLIQSVKVHDLPDPFITKLSIVSRLWPQLLWQTKICSTGNGVHTNGEDWFLHPFVLERWEMVQPVLIRAILQLAKAAAMCTASYAENHLPPPPLAFAF